MRSNLPDEIKIFQSMCEIAPDLKYIRGEAEILLNDENNPDFWENYDHVKEKIARLVGFRAPKSFPEFMRTSNSYDIVVRNVFVGLV